MSCTGLLVFLLLAPAVIRTQGVEEVTGGLSPVYAKLSETVTLKWRYRLLSPSDLLYVKICRTPMLSNSCDDWDVGRTPIAFGAGSSPAQPNANNADYYSRIQLSTLNNEVTLEVRRLTESDTGGFKFEMQARKLVFNVTQVIIVVDPQITGDRSPIISASEFDNVSMPCTAGVGNPRPLKFTWKRRAEDPLKPDIFVAESWEMHSFHLNLSRIGRQNRGVYKCIVENRFSAGSDTYEVELRIRYRPVIVSPPLNRTVLENAGDTYMDCSADGNDGTSKSFTWHWYKDAAQVWRAIQSGITHPEITISADGSRLLFTKPPRSLAGYYFCAAENALGIGAAQGAALNVTYSPGKVEVPLVDGQVIGRERENLTVKCSSDANPPAVYSWYKEEAQPSGASRFILLVFRDPSGSLQLFNVSKNDSSKYKCVAENRPNLQSPASWESNELIVPINIYYAPRVTNISVNARNDSKIFIKKGDKASIVCRSDSNPPAVFNIQRQGEGIKLGSDSGVHTIDSIDVTHEGIYLCIARNQILGSSVTVSVEIIVTVEPSLLSSSENQSPREGAHLELECTFSGKPAPLIFWQFFGSNFTNDSVRQTSYVVVRQESVLTTVQSKLSFSGVRHTDDGFFSCIAYNFAENVNKTFKFDVSYAPKITVRPQNFTLQEGSGKGFNLVCNAKGKPDVASWLWKKDGVEMSNVKSNFEMQVPKREDNGVYTCQGRNAVGIGELATAVVVIEYRAQLTVWPQSQVLNVSGSVTLMCDGIGVPEPMFLWLKKGDSTFRSEGRTVTFANVDAQSKGEYSCSANNSIGGDTRVFLIQVQHAPDITSSRSYQTKVGTEVGGEAVLTCAVDSYPAAVITWKVVGQANPLISGGDYTISTLISGSSSTLEVAVKEKHIGMKFLCEARNAFGQDQQEFQILMRQKPEPPELIEVSDELQPTVPPTVDIKLKWIPGFNGGLKVDFFLYYREASLLSDRIEFMGNAVDYVYVLRMQKPGVRYILSIKARNELGSSALYEPQIEFITKQPPPDVANVTLTRVGDGSTVLVSWRISGSAATRKKRASRRKRAVDNNWDYALIRYRNIDAAELVWTEHKVSNIQLNGSYPISGLNRDDLYEFHFILYDKNGRFALPVSAGKLRPGGDGIVVKRSTSELSRTHIIVIAASCGGFILILVVIFCIVIWKTKEGSRKKQLFAAQHNGNRAQDIPISTAKSGYSYHSASDVVRSNMAPEVEEDSFTGNGTENNREIPPPGYSDFHYNYNEGSDYNDAPASAFRHADDSAPRYTSFGRLPKDNVKPVAGQVDAKSSTSMNGARAGEISKRTKPLKSGDAPAGFTVEDEEVAELPSFMREDLRSPHADKGNDVRAPGSFGDQIGVRQQKAAKRTPASYGNPPPAPVSFLGPSGPHSPSSSQASSKPYRSDNEYIDDIDENYVGYLV